MIAASETPSGNISFTTHRITAVWALSESALAGILHTFKIPFTGLAMASAAVVFIVLLHHFDGRKGVILKATLLVLLVKALVSPHIPLNAFLAVSFQGLAGEIIFNFLPNKKLAAVALGIVALLQSALQKLLVLTIIFGQALWKSIDVFGRFIIDQVGLHFDGAGLPELSLWLIFVYSGLHLAAGIFSGIYAANLSLKITLRHQNPEFEKSISAHEIKIPVHNAVSKKRRLRPLPVVIFSLALAIFLLSYIFPVLEQDNGLHAGLMIIRSFLILIIWYYVLAPLIQRRMRGYLDQKKNIYAEELNHILSLLPLLRQLAVYSWAQSARAGFLRRLLRFPEHFFVLLVDLNVSENNFALKSLRDPF